MTFCIYKIYYSVLNVHEEEFQEKDIVGFFPLKLCFPLVEKYDLLDLWFKSQYIPLYHFHLFRLNSHYLLLFGFVDNY